MSSYSKLGLADAFPSPLDCIPSSAVAQNASPNHQLSPWRLDHQLNDIRGLASLSYESTLCKEYGTKGHLENRLQSTRNHHVHPHSCILMEPYRAAPHTRFQKRRVLTCPRTRGSFFLFILQPSVVPIKISCWSLVGNLIGQEAAWLIYQLPCKPSKQQLGYQVESARCADKYRASCPLLGAASSVTYWVGLPFERRLSNNRSCGVNGRSEIAESRVLYVRDYGQDHQISPHGSFKQVFN